MSQIFIVPQLGFVGDNPCYPNEQSRYLDFMTKTQWAISLGAQVGVIISDVQPSVENNDKLWYQLDSATGGLAVPVPFVYSTVYGQWVARNPREPVTYERMIWVGTLTDLWSHDGGDGSDPGAIVPTPTTGAMWEMDANFADRIPGGVGVTLAPVSSDHDILPAAASGGPAEVRAVYLAKRTARIFYVP